MITINFCESIFAVDNIYFHNIGMNSYKFRQVLSMATRQGYLVICVILEERLVLTIHN